MIYRAWVEINLNALRHNAKLIQQHLSDQCCLMAVLKANAYGHGDVMVAKTLNKMGVYSFAVATLKEGIHLRKAGIKGEILILGYTNPMEFRYLVHYHLTQAVIDFEYAKCLNAFGKKMKVHIKIDTGMHRLGFDFEENSNMEKIFHFPNLQIEGMFTHLCTADSLESKDINYSELQINRFYEGVTYLQEKGYATGKIHMQSSYGLLNYPDYRCDYARIGIALYGVLSKPGDTLTTLNLQPVLTLKARIAMVKQIAVNESVSYGRTFIAEREMKIATVSIGYADGIPRNLGDTKGYVLVHGKKAFIIGRICMDQFVIDITNIGEVKSNDAVTIIGMDQEEQIRCEEFAEQCGTITNEILSRLGNRLDYIYVN